MLIKYFADIRRLSGCDEQRWEEATPVLRVLLEELGREHGAPFARRVLEDGRLSPTIIILVNGQHVSHLRGLDTELGSDDTVAIFPMVAGG